MFSGIVNVSTQIFLHNRLNRGCLELCRVLSLTLGAYLQSYDIGKYEVCTDTPFYSPLPIITP